MWYKIARGMIGGGAIKAAPLLPISQYEGQLEAAQYEVKEQHNTYEKFNQELKFLLEQMGKTIEDFQEMAEEEQKELWDILVFRPHHIGGAETNGDVASGVYGDQLASNMARMQSPYHDYFATNLEGLLEGSRHFNNNVDPINMQKLEKAQGAMLVRGIPQYNSGKPTEREDLPSNIRFV
jgi:hypothetical protein